MTLSSRLAPLNKRTLTAVAAVQTAPAPAPALRVSVYEHRLTAEASPIAALAMTIPAGTRHSASEEDHGQVAACYKHAILQVQSHPPPSPSSPLNPRVGQRSGEPRGIGAQGGLATVAARRVAVP